MNTFPARQFVQSLLAGLVLLMTALQAQATAPRFSAAKLAGEAPPHLVAYEYAPLVTGNETEPGAAVEIVRKSFEAMGKTIPLEVSPSKSFATQLLTTDAKVMGLLGEARALPAEERKGLAEEKCLRLTGKYYYYRPARGQAMANVHDLKDLKGYTYGAVPEESTAVYTKAGIKVVVDEPKSLFRKLQAREIDFVSAFEPNGDGMIAQLFPAEKDSFATLPMQAWETAYSVWFNKEHKPAQEWQKTFVEGLKKLKQSGAYLEILKKYHLEKWALMP